MATRHNAFISYSHRSDSKLAKALEEGLEKLAKPLLKIRAMDVFRDETSLAANPSLWAGILEHLSGSTWLVIIACPEWAASAWCLREVQWWIENRTMDRMLIVVSGGELAWNAGASEFQWPMTTALPRELSGRFQEEPFYVDLRWTKDSSELSLRQPGFRDAVLNIGAPIRGVRKDELDGADVRQHRRNRLFLRAGVTAIALAAVVAIWQAVVATQQRNEARRQTTIALSRALGALAQLKLTGEKPQLDVALLIATHAVQLDEHSGAQSALLVGLQKHPRLERLLWPGSRTYAIEFSPDGKRLASAGEGGTISVWDPATGSRILEIPGAHKEEIWDLAFLPGSRRLLTGSLDKTAAIWDIETGMLVGQRLTGHQDEILAVAVSRDGKLAVTACLDGSVRIWDLANQQTIRAIARAHDRGVRSVAFHPDGKSVVTGGFDGMIKVWSVTSGEQLAGPGKAHRGTVMRLAFSPDGNILASAGADGSALRWDSRSWKPIGETLDGDGKEIAGLAFSPDGKELAAGTWGKSIYLWRFGRTEDETETESYEYHNNQVWQVAFRPDGKQLAAASWDSSISVWNLAGSSGLREETADLPEGLHGLSIHPDGRIVALGGADGNIYIHSWDSLAEPAILRGQGSEIMTLAYSGRGSLLASGGLGTVALWDVRGEKRRMWIAREHKEGVFGLAFSPDEKTLISSGGDGVLVRWDVATGKPIGPAVQAHERGAGSASVAFDPLGDFYASAGRGRAVILWDAKTGQQFRTLIKDNLASAFDAVAFSPDGKFLVAASGAWLYLWKDRKWDSFERFTGGPQGIEKLAFGGDSRTLIVGDDGGEIYLANVETKQVQPEPIRGAGQVWGLDVSHDGRRIAASFPHHTAYLFNMDPKVWMDQACRISNRELRPAEWTEMIGPIPYQKICGNAPGR